MAASLLYDMRAGKSKAELPDVGRYLTGVNPGFSFTAKLFSGIICP